MDLFRVAQTQYSTAASHEYFYLWIRSRGVHGPEVATDPE